LLLHPRQLLENKWLVRLRQDKSIREALFAFLLTRILIFVVLICVPLVNIVPPNDPYINLEKASIARQLRKTFAQADTNHYMGIAQEGYKSEPFDVNSRRSQTYAFFPLLPILLWILRQTTSDAMLWGALLCNLFFFLALVLLYRLTVEFGYGDTVARRTIFYVAAFPVSYFFSAPFTESIFLFLTVASVYAAKRERWWLAGVFGLFGSATRLTAVMLLPALVVLSWQMYRSLQIKKILGLLLIPFGLFSYMFFSWRMTGDALAFVHASAAWGRKPSIFILGPLFNYLIHPYEIVAGWHFNLLNACCALLCFFAIYVLVRRREWALALYTLLAVVLPLSTGVMQSLERYTMGFFPVFIALAVTVRSEHTDHAIRFVFVFLLGIMTLIYTIGLAMALS
jgi:Gpi18-like mannosyltransferase